MPGKGYGSPGTPRPYARREARTKDSPFRIAIYAAVDRIGVSLPVAAHRAGLSREAVHSWMNGGRRPYRSSVMRLAEALHAPELITAIATRPDPPPRLIADETVWLRNAASASGFPTWEALAQGIGAPGQTVRRWGRGHRPTRHWISPLAIALSLTEQELVEAVWGERIGSQCECCGGVKALPEAAGSRSLATVHTCGGCGLQRTYAPGAGHYTRHHGCTWSVPRVRLECVGYMDHDVHRFNKNCPRAVELLPGRVNARKSGVAHRGPGRFNQAQPAFTDESSGTFRCGRCAGAARGIAMTEHRIREFTDERIRTPAARKALLTELGDLLPRPPRGPKRSSAYRTVPTRARIYSWWGRAELPTSTHVRLCLGCSTLVLARPYPSDWHFSCWNDLLQTPKGRARLRDKMPGEALDLGRLVKRQRGRPKDDYDLLKRRFAWAICHHLGNVTTKDLARRYGVAQSTVSEGISFIMGALPDLNRVRKPFRPHIRLLAAEARISR